MLVATHSGHFHADDVFAFAMLRTFVKRELQLIRTRDLQRIAEADIAIDVGGEYDPARKRFDHHQRDYEGTLSSAGMVLQWLQDSGKVSEDLATRLRADWIDYIDDVDTGRRKPDAGVPCIATLVGHFAERAENDAEFDGLYMQAVDVCEHVLQGVLTADRKSQEARAAIAAAMARAEQAGTRILELDRHYKWKRAYFEQGGATHPTDYVLFPDRDSWRILAIPPEKDSFAQKRPLPEAWAGLVDDALSEVVGVQGAKFCHKNRFIAVFASEAAAREAIARWGLHGGD